MTLRQGVLSAVVVICTSCGQRNMLPPNLVGAKKCRHCGSPVKR